MKLLIDTHVLLWWMGVRKRLPRKALGLISDPSNTVLVSAASVWEIRIKEAIGKLRLPASFGKVLAEEEFEELPVTIAHAHAAGRLALHHRDPFDRILIAQAICEDLTILTHDARFASYPAAHVLV